ncbi:keratin, type I cytoskeletal 9 [Eurytemora carolleeae]|uniref:keratin, type I cytoskeletal 9 n=1 Tax=Eurytemora carolleeae TaxID=1294199 RepID=UPI000C780251|nr:keratin, type I cytoskeletal 9 [Eurytemora carolleeae]|eukprot:XP_023343807.1 keratin, type I cytoskeletal 9-like [Eurytemora affinis]
MSDGSGLQEGPGSDGRAEEGGESKTSYLYRGRGRITGGTSRGRGKRENDEGESSRGGGERGKGRGGMDNKDGGESSGAGGGRGRGRGSSGRGISYREDGGTTRERSNGGGGGTGRGKIYKVSEEGRRKTGETGQGRSNGRGQAKGRVNQNKGTEISNKGTKGKRSDKEDKGMSRRDSKKEREGSAGGPGGSIRTLVGRLLTGRFDDGGGIKISGDEGVQSRFDKTDTREKVKTSWPFETSAIGGKGEISSAVGGKGKISSTVGVKGEISSADGGKREICLAVGEKGEMSSVVGEKGEISSAAGGSTKTTRRELKITKKIVKEPYYKRDRVVRKPPPTTELIDKSTSKFMAVWKRRRLRRYQFKAKRTLRRKKKTYRTEWKVRNKFGIRECNYQVTKWRFILNSDQV